MTALINFCGTSLVNQGDASNSNGISHTSKGWFRWAQRFSGWRFEAPVWRDTTVVPGWEPSGTPGATREFWGFNTGVSGQTIDQIWDRRAEVAAIGGDFIFVDAGTNDMTIQTGEYIHQKRVDLTEYFLSKGFKKVFLLTILARDIATWSGETREKFTLVNRLTKEAFRNNPNVVIIDWNEPWIDFLTGEPMPGYSIDGTHYDGVGAFHVGKYIAEKYINSLLAERIPFTTGVDDVYSANNPLGNSLDNPYMQGTSGNNGTNSSGDVADNFRVEVTVGDATVVNSKVVDATVPGGVTQRLTITPGTTGTSSIIFRTSSADVAHNYAGKWVRAGIGVRVNTDNDTINEILFKFEDQAPDGIEARENLQVGNNFPTESFDCYFQTPHLLMENDSTVRRFRVDIEVDNTKSNAVEIEFYNGWVREVSNPVEEYNTAAPSQTVYNVSQGKSVTTLFGMRYEGDGVTADDFEDGEVTLNQLITDGFVE